MLALPTWQKRYATEAEDALEDGMTVVSRTNRFSGGSGTVSKTGPEPFVVNYGGGLVDE